MRVVSLVPSITETLLAWDVEPMAVTRFCEQPGLRAVGGTKDPDVASIVALGPDLVLMNDEENRKEDADALRAAGLAVHVVSIRSVAGVGPALDELAERLRVVLRPRRTAVAPIAGGAVAPPTAFVPIWRRPWMSLNGDTYGSDLLRHCGVHNVFHAHEDRYPRVRGLDEVAGIRPDVVIAPSEPYPFGARHHAELETVAPVLFVDGKDLFWWGVRTPAAIARLAAILRPLR